MSCMLYWVTMDIVFCAAVMHCEAHLSSICSVNMPLEQLLGSATEQHWASNGLKRRIRECRSLPEYQSDFLVCHFLAFLPEVQNGRLSRSSGIAQGSRASVF
jgi:hypothetical protein